MMLFSAVSTCGSMHRVVLASQAPAVAGSDLLTFRSLLATAFQTTQYKRLDAITCIMQRTLTAPKRKKRFSLTALHAGQVEVFALGYIQQHVQP